MHTNDPTAHQSRDVFMYECQLSRVFTYLCRSRPVFHLCGFPLLCFKKISSFISLHFLFSFSFIISGSLFKWRYGIHPKSINEMCMIWRTRRQAYPEWWLYLILISKTARVKQCVYYSEKHNYIIKTTKYSYFCPHLCALPLRLLHFRTSLTIFFFSLCHYTHAVILTSPSLCPFQYISNKCDTSSACAAHPVSAQPAGTHHSWIKYRCLRYQSTIKCSEWTRSHSTN